MEEYDTVALKLDRLTKMPAGKRQKLVAELNKQMSKAAKEF